MTKTAGSNWMLNVLLVALVVGGLVGVSTLAFCAKTVPEEATKAEATYTGISKDRSCTWWLDESLTVPKEDREKIKKVFEALEKKLEKDGIDSVTFPWKPPKEEKKAEEKKEEKKELSAEQKKWEEEELLEEPDRFPSVVIPSKEDLNIVKIDGVPTGTLFVVRGTLAKPRIEVWRLKLERKDEEWSIKSKEVEYSFDQVFLLRMREKTAYDFKQIKIDHDLMHISIKDGRFYPLYDGSDKIIGGTAFGKGMLNYKPPTKLAKDWETDQEVYQLKLHTKELTGKAKEELKDVAFNKITFFFSPTNFDRYVKIEGLKKFEIKDKKELEEAKELISGEINWLATTNYGVRLPYKGQPKGKKKTIMLYYLPRYDELCDIYLYTPKYYWIGYYDWPPAPWSGIQEEIQLYQNREVPLKVGGEKVGGPWCWYNRPDQRASLTRREAEYEPIAEVRTIDRKVDVNVGYKEKSVESLRLGAPDREVGLTSVGRTAIFAKFRSTIEVEVTRAGASVLPFAISSLRAQPRIPMKFRKVVDDRGLDILRFGTFTLVFPPLALGQRVRFTAEYEGPLCARIVTTSTYSSGSTQWFPEYGFLECAPLEIVLGVPKPYTGVSVGQLIQSWTAGDQNFTHWASDECIRMAAILYSDYAVKEVLLTKPNGESLDFYFYYYPKMTLYLSDADYIGFQQRHRRMQEERRQPGDRYDWRTAVRIHKIDFSVRNPDGIVTEFKSILEFQQALYLPLPYKKLAAVMLPILSGYGQGMPTMLQLDGWSFASAGDKALYEVPPGRWGAEFWSHESGHQYWGHVVGWRAPRDQWFSEAFTEQQCAMYMQASRGQVQYIDKLEEWRGYALLPYGQKAPLTLGGPRFGDRLVWYCLFYAKGPYVVHMIRQMIGDKAFIAYERNILRSMYWKNPTTSDLCSVLEATLGKENMLRLFGKDNMQWFFDQWIYGVGIPSYDYGYELFTSNGEHYARIKVRHKGVQFRVRIPIWVYPESGKRYAIPLLLTGEKPIEEITVKLRGPAKKLVLDEFGAVLTRKIKKVKYSKIR